MLPEGRTRSDGAATPPLSLNLPNMAGSGCCRGARAGLSCWYSLCASTRSICMLYGTRGSGSSEKKLFMAPATVFTVKSFSAKSRLWSERKLGE